MNLDSNRHVYEALTRHNYFPNQKEGEEELPPCFSTKRYTPELVEKIVLIQESASRRKVGYDQVEYSLTRHSNVPRKLGLIHPKAYADLSKLISDNWTDIQYVSQNECSVIKPNHHLDGRMLIMNYEDATDKIRRSSVESFAKRFRVHSDISSCFHSIYSHSIPWAVLGFEQSKMMMSTNSLGQHWSDKLDTCIRKSKRNETLGVAIGPASSSIVVELILGRVDKELSRLGFEFKRYIDDYVCNCYSSEDADLFLRVLGKELNKYKLNINLHKTRVVELPVPTSDEWIIDLASHLPSNYIDEVYSRRKYLLPEVISYLDAAVKINKRTPDGSVLKYALKTVLRQISDYAIDEVLAYVMNLSWYYPVLLPMLEVMLSHELVNPERYAVNLNLIIAENAKRSRSDGMVWPLYYLKKFNLEVSVEAYSEVIKSKDCLAILCLYKLDRVKEHILTFAHELLCKTDYEKDQYWVLLYEIYRDGHIPEVYEDGVFSLMKKFDVTFMPELESTSGLEKYCEYVNGPFNSWGLNADDLSEFVEVGLVGFDEWAKVTLNKKSSDLNYHKVLIEAVLPLHMLCDSSVRRNWVPLFKRLCEVIKKENYYPWYENEHFIVVLNAVVHVQLNKMNYSEVGYEGSKDYIVSTIVNLYKNKAKNA